MNSSVLESEFAIHRRKRVPAAAHIDVKQYRQRLVLVADSIFEGLEQNDRRFNGDDGIEAVIVYGSYAKSLLADSGRALVHNRTELVPESDLDLMFINQGGEPPLLEALNNEDLALPFNSGLIHPSWRLQAQIQANLANRGLYLNADFGDHWDINDSEMIMTGLSEARREVVKRLALVFIDPNSKYKRDIADMMEKVRVNTVIYPHSSRNGSAVYFLAAASMNPMNIG